MKAAKFVPSGAFSDKHREKIEELSIPEPNSGCWIWLGVCDQSGYGMFYAKEVGNIRAHRASYAIYHGDIPAGLVVRHKCDNAYCVNPAHLETGTQQQNIRDSVARGRFRPTGRKLTLQMAIEIFESVEPARVVALRYGICKYTVKSIRVGRVWPQVSVGLLPHPRAVLGPKKSRDYHARPVRISSLDRPLDS